MDVTKQLGTYNIPLDDTAILEPIFSLNIIKLYIKT